MSVSVNTSIAFHSLNHQAMMYSYLEDDLARMFGPTHAGLLFVMFLRLFKKHLHTIGQARGIRYANIQNETDVTDYYSIRGQFSGDGSIPGPKHCDEIVDLKINSTRIGVLYPTTMILHGYMIGFTYD
jgi:hypothetical protein